MCTKTTPHVKWTYPPFAGACGAFAAPVIDRTLVQFIIFSLLTMTNVSKCAINNGIIARNDSDEAIQVSIACY